MTNVLKSEPCIMSRIILFFYQVQFCYLIQNIILWLLKMKTHDGHVIIVSCVVLVICYMYLLRSYLFWISCRINFESFLYVP